MRTEESGRGRGIEVGGGRKEGGRREEEREIGRKE